MQLQQQTRREDTLRRCPRLPAAALPLLRRALLLLRGAHALLIEARALARRAFPPRRHLDEAFAVACLSLTPQLLASTAAVVVQVRRASHRRRALWGPPWAVVVARVQCG